MGKSIKTLVDEFLLASLFGSDYKKTDKKKLAIDRAYRDFCRTIRKDEGCINAGMDIEESRNNATEIITAALSLDMSDYDTWHKTLCNDIKESGYTYGQAQKWVNMTMKYLLVLDYGIDNTIIEQLHIPIDSIIIEKSLKKDLIDKETIGMNFSWSKISNYADYKKIQEKLRTKLGNQTPIKWEFQAWNE